MIPVRTATEPAITGGLRALPRLVSTDIETFSHEVWGRLAWFSPAGDLPGDVHDLFSAAVVDELVSTRGLRTPFLRVAKNGSTLPDRAFTAGGGLGAAIGDQVSDDKLLALFADGATLVLQGLHRTWPPLVAFCQQLAEELGHPVQANAYVTPPQSRGFDDHYDVHDVFVVQVAGEKRWRIHPPVHESPLPDQPWTDRRAAVAAAAETEPLLDVVLRPGDCLYLPRGYLHAATALGAVSTHLTLGVHAWTRYALAEDVLAAALQNLSEDSELRRSLPIGSASAGSALAGSASVPASLVGDLELVRARLLDVVRDLPLAPVAERQALRRKRSQRAAPVGPIAQVEAAAGLADGVLWPELALRAHLLGDVVSDGDGLVLRSRAGEVGLDPEDVADVRTLLTTGRLDHLAADLTRRLVLAGVLVPVAAPG
ncbi:cupin domain-containing protein [Angustibacter sp. McL0619]|uniref:cupin domain-containing protein n=1 Tax=Angustibacter sp. McL0619 TaxID=3415676 RepID=UPI003CEA7FEE